MRYFICSVGLLGNCVCDVPHRILHAYPDSFLVECEGVPARFEAELSVNDVRVDSHLTWFADNPGDNPGWVEGC